MKSFITLCSLLLVISLTYATILGPVTIRNVITDEIVDTSSYAKLSDLEFSVGIQNGPTIDGCYYCVDFMSEAVDELLNIILNGVLGSCAEVCGYLSDPILQVPCILVCEYVGVNEFVNVINDTDPDPIYYCQEFDMCPVVNGGQVAITHTHMSPISGEAGTTFNVTWTYKVIAPTGPGLLSIVVLPPANDGFDMPFGFGGFIEGQAVGIYEAEAGIDTTPQEMEPFNAGTWVANVAVCAGDCTNDHPYGGVYADVNVTFTITNSSEAEMSANF